jgi:WD40 repeat protein
MFRIFRTICLLLGLVVVSCTSLTQIITPENVYEIEQMDYVNENGAKADISLPIGAGYIVNNVAFSPKGDILAVGYRDEARVDLYNVATGELLAQLDTLMGRVWSIAFSPDGKLIAASGGENDVVKNPAGDVEIWNLATRELFLKLDSFHAVVKDIAFSPNSTILATVEGIAWEPNIIKIWNIANGELIDEFSTPTNRITFDPDGTLLATIRSNCSMGYKNQERDQGFTKSNI